MNYYSKKYHISLIGFTLLFFIVASISITLITSVIVILLNQPAKPENLMLQKIMSKWRWVVEETNLKNYIPSNSLPPSASDKTGVNNDSSEKIVVEIKGLKDKLEEIESSTIINPHPFQFTLNPGYSVCSTK